MGHDLRAPYSLTEGQTAVSTGLQVLGIVVAGGAQVDTVVALSNLYGLLPLAGGLVELVEEVVAPALLVELFSVVLVWEGNSALPQLFTPTLPTGCPAAKPTVSTQRVTGTTRTTAHARRGHCGVGTVSHDHPWEVLGSPANDKALPMLLP